MTDVSLCAFYFPTNPGPPHGLRVQEVRKDSMVLLWDPPTFNGRSPVTGYYVDYKEENGKWRCVQERSTKHTYMKVINEIFHTATVLGLTVSAISFMQLKFHFFGDRAVSMA